jgi:ELWxxDGT repeat protein
MKRRLLLSVAAMFITLLCVKAQNPKYIFTPAGEPIPVDFMAKLDDHRYILLSRDETDFFTLYAYDDANGSITTLAEGWKLATLCAIDPYQNHAVNGKIYAVANAGGKKYLYATDGTLAGTQPIADFGNAEDNQRIMVEMEGIVFMTDGNGNEQHLWRSDGTAAGTYKVTPETFQTESTSSLSITIKFSSLPMIPTAV